MSNIAVNDIWVTGSPQLVVDGEVLTYSVRYKHNIDSVGTMKIWKNGSSDESGTMLSGALVKDGNVLTLKTIDFTGYGGSILIAEWSATVNGQVEIRKCEFICRPGKSRT